ncbi:TolC family protein [bacterium]|nr:TolC family protein [bacterium]
MKKFASLILCISLVLWSGKISFGQEKLTLTLEKSIQMALSQNPRYLASEERVEAAQSRVREAAAQFFPSLNIQGTNTLDEKLFQLEFPSIVPGQPPRKVSVDFTRDYQFAFAFSLPLFTSGRLTSGFKRAKYNLHSTQERREQSEQQTVCRIKKAFYGYLLAKEFVGVAKEAVEVAEEHHKNVRNLHEVGMASRFDLLRSEVQVANLKPQYIKAKNNLKVAALRLKTLLGMDLSQPVEIKGKLSYEPYKPDLEKCVSQALQNRPELGQLKFQKKSAGEMVKIARASHLPTVSVSGNYNFWADQFNFKEDNWQSYYTFNMVLTIPIFNGFATSAKVAQSRARLRELEWTQRGLEDQIRLEVRQALLKLEEAKESLLSQKKNVQQAQESLRIAELNYSEGMATTLDVSSAQSALTQAKTNCSQALYDYMVSRAELEKAMGMEWEKQSEQE